MIIQKTNWSWSKRDGFTFKKNGYVFFTVTPALTFHVSEPLIFIDKNHKIRNS